jgi:hypothetical protein
MPDSPHLTLNKIFYFLEIIDVMVQFKNLVS